MKYRSEEVRRNARAFIVSLRQEAIERQRSRLQNGKASNGQTNKKQPVRLLEHSESISASPNTVSPNAVSPNTVSDEVTQSDMPEKSPPVSPRRRRVRRWSGMKQVEAQGEQAQKTEISGRGRTRNISQRSSTSDDSRAPRGRSVSVFPMELIGNEVSVDATIAAVSSVEDEFPDATTSLNDAAALTDSFNSLDTEQLSSPDGLSISPEDEPESAVSGSAPEPISVVQKAPPRKAKSRLKQGGAKRTSRRTQTATRGNRRSAEQKARAKEEPKSLDLPDTESDWVSVKGEMTAQNVIDAVEEILETNIVSDKTETFPASLSPDSGRVMNIVSPLRNDGVGAADTDAGQNEHSPDDEKEPIDLTTFLGTSEAEVDEEADAEADADADAGADAVEDGAVSSADNELPNQPDAPQEVSVAEPPENEIVAFEPWSAEDENAGYAADSDVLVERPAEMEMPSEEEVSPEMGEADEPEEISDEMVISHEPDEISVEMAGEARRQTDEREKGFSAGAFDRVAKIGPGMQMRLHDAGIRSVEDLAFADIDELKVRLGAAARLANVDEWHRLARAVVGESDG